ncbi:hypothetical protein D0962_37195 [Leptolyngbyaceae cyanobacterium CCMR0082]|uniref:Uncharacterized protein n=1 Tax=Adonisia turfae CCMR0082 TaxID=2304604 RepID=A0A6M0SIM7_9CYAN|nr:hypothetical protein [Adonisia turfae]NEZ68305.1 hypothetical protein [Adonisia turfae CCMR0082]
MNWRKLATRAGLSALERATQPGSVDEISCQTALAANVWALAHPSIGQEPFPDVQDGDLVLSDAFLIPRLSWGWVWFQRQFSLIHRQSGVESRWINRRTAPQDVLD